MGANGIFGWNGWLLVTASVAVYAAVAVVTRLAAERMVARARRPSVTSLVGPLTPALATLFAVLMAFTVVTEAGYLRTGQMLASEEAAAASRIAWASTDPGLDGAPIRAALDDYLETLVRVDWSGRTEGARTPPAVVRALQGLETATRVQAAAPGLASPVTTELFTALDSLTSTRRELVAESTRRIPTAYLLMLALAGAVLIVNVSVLTLATGRRGLWLTIGLVLVVSTSLALLVGVSASFAGPLRVNHSAIDRMILDLRAGVFSLR